LNELHELISAKRKKIQYLKGHNSSNSLNSCNSWIKKIYQP